MLLRHYSTTIPPLIILLSLPNQPSSNHHLGTSSESSPTERDTYFIFLRLIHVMAGSYTLSKSNPRLGTTRQTRQNGVEQQVAGTGIGITDEPNLYVARMGSFPLINRFIGWQSWGIACHSGCQTCRIIYVLLACHTTTHTQHYATVFICKGTVN